MAFDFNSSSATGSSSGDGDSRRAEHIEQHLRALAQAQYGYLTTRGRVSGGKHEVEIWFAADGAHIYMMSGGREKADWVKNIRRNPSVSMRIASTIFTGDTRLVAPGDEDMHIREQLAAKYQQWRPGLPLSDWARTSLPVAIDVRQVLDDAAPTTSDQP